MQQNIVSRSNLYAFRRMQKILPKYIHTTSSVILDLLYNPHIIQLYHVKWLSCGPQLLTISELSRQEDCMASRSRN
jgi:hypothetical protein